MSFIKIVVQKLDINLIAKIVIESAIKNRIVFAVKEIIIEIWKKIVQKQEKEEIRT